MSDRDAVRHDLQIASERAKEGRRQSDKMLLEETVLQLKPRMPAVVLPIGSSVDQVIALMKKNAVGHILITEDERVIGIITERDIVRKATGGDIDPGALSVQDIMTPHPETLRLDDFAVLALNKMGIGEFRHLPLVDDDGRPVGSISVRHVVRYLADCFAKDVINLPPKPAADIPIEREGA